MTRLLRWALGRWADQRQTWYMVALEQRTRVLEHDLRRYGMHLGSCALSGFSPLTKEPVRRGWQEGDYDLGCTCSYALAIEPHRRGQDRLGAIG